MGTRSNIGLQAPDGSVRAIYCHWGGYPKHNGKILLEHYSDPKKVEALLKLGSLSSLKEEIGEKHPFDWLTDKSELERKGKKLPEKYALYEKWCVAYGRDRGEKDCGAVRYASLDKLREGMEEYAYVLTDKGWVFSDRGSNFRWLTAKICAGQEESFVRDLDL